MTMPSDPSTAAPSSDTPEVTVRDAVDADRPLIEQIFLGGREDGMLRKNDTAADISHLDEAYLGDEGKSGFWVADCGGTIVGMVGVQRTSNESADIRRLRVTPEFRRRGIGSRLLATAIDHCRSRGFLKVVLDVNVDRQPAVAMFRKFGFTISRERMIDGRATLDFMLDLYSEGLD